MCQGPTNKSTKIPKYFWSFLISKRGLFGQISNQNGHKNYSQGIRVCFAEHTLSKHNLGRMGLKPRPGPILFLLLFLRGWVQPNRIGWTTPSYRPGYWFKPVTPPVSYNPQYIYIYIYIYPTSKFNMNITYISYHKI